MENGNPFPVIVKKRLESTGPLEVNIREKIVTRREFNQEQVSLDSIVKDSDSKFYITGRTTKIAFTNFIQLISKHNIGEVEGLEREDIVLSSDLVTRLATASVVDADEEFLHYVDASAIGIFLASFVLSFFSLVSKTLSDLKSFSWILLLISGLFLLHYTYRGLKSGELKRVWRLMLKSLTKH